MTLPDRKPFWHYRAGSGRGRAIRLCLVLTALTALIAARIALTTPFDHPPDEFVHLDAFHYFETNWWPPDLNADGLIYSPAGWSRVYTGELVYLVYGKIGALARLLPFGPGAEPPLARAGATGSVSLLPASPDSRRPSPSSCSPSTGCSTWHCWWAPCSSWR